MQTTTIDMIKIKGEHIQMEDLVALESTYKICINHDETFSVTCTPTDMEEMVLGALFSRGYICCAEQVENMDMDSDILVTLKDEVPVQKVDSGEVMLTDEQIFSIAEALFREPGELFQRTGCAHSCSLVKNGEILCTYEDIGRHNALDKVIGHALKHRIPLAHCVIFSSGRISGDYLMKVIHAGVKMAVSRAAVTSEAVRLARKHKIRMYGFVRGNSANLYNEEMR